MQINKYNVPKGGATTGGGSVVIGGGATTAATIIAETHTIFGQPFNGTQDVKGDITEVQNIESIGGDITVKATSDTEDKAGGNITAEGTIKGGQIISDKGVFKEITGENLNYPIGKINEISGTSLSYDSGSVQTLNATSIEAERANIVNAIIEEELQASDITVNTLYVNGSAHFFKLIIDEVKSSGGQVILTPASATLSFARKLESGDYKCYWKSDDGGKQTYNQFEAGDLVICQKFNVKQASTNNNKYYWRKCYEAGTEIINNYEYNYVILSGTEKDPKSNGEPIGNDTIVQLGHSSDKTRQNAIVLSAYSNSFLDPELKAPSIVQYRGIRTFELKPYRANVISAGLNEFTGNFKVTSGQSLEDYINTQVTTKSQGVPYISDQGNWMFYKNGAYIDSGINALGEKHYKLNPIKVVALVDENSKLGVSLRYEVLTKEAKNFTIESVINGNVYTLNQLGGIYSLDLNLDYSKEYPTIITSLKSGELLDVHTIPVTLMPAASMKITQGLQASIEQAVQGTENLESTVQNQIAQIKQTTDSITSRVSKVEISQDNLLANDFFAGYKVGNNSYSFPQNLEEYAHYPMMKLEAGKYIMSFSLGSTNRCQIRFNLFATNQWVGKSKEHFIIRNTDIPEKKLYSYEFTVEDSNPYLIVLIHNYNEANVVNNWSLVRITDAQSVIKQSADNIKLQVKDAGIDIENKQINLNAENCNFIGADGKTYIKVSVDSKGLPHLIFYGVDGETPMYDLGYTGFKQLITNAVDGKFIPSMRLYNITDKHLYDADKIIRLKEHSGAQYYIYAASYQIINKQTIYGDDEDFDGMYYTTNSSQLIENKIELADSLYYIPDGVYMQTMDNYLQNVDKDLYLISIYKFI